MRTLPKVGIQSAQDAISFAKIQKATDNIAKQLFQRKYSELSMAHQLMADSILLAKIDRGEKAEFKEHSEFGKEAARQIAIDHLAEDPNAYPLMEVTAQGHIIRKPQAKGWHGNYVGHSNARKFGHAGGKQQSSTTFWNKRIALAGLKGKALVKAIRKQKKNSMLK